MYVLVKKIVYYNVYPVLITTEVDMPELLNKYMYIHISTDSCTSHPLQYCEKEVQLFSH